MTIQETKDKIQSYITTQQTYHIDAYDMENITEEVYGNTIEMLGSKNNTHQYTVTSSLSDSDKKTLQNAIQKGHLDYEYYRVILNDLCQKGYIQLGSYYLTT